MTYPQQVTTPKVLSGTSKAGSEPLEDAEQTARPWQKEKGMDNVECTVIRYFIQS